MFMYGIRFFGCEHRAFTDRYMLDEIPKGIAEKATKSNRFQVIDELDNSILYLKKSIIIFYYKYN